MVKKKQFIGGNMLRRESMKKQYVPGPRLLFDFLDIREDEKWGAVATIKSETDVFGKMTKKEREGISKALEDPKPVDTSKWVRPDRESIRHTLVTNLFLTEIYERDSGDWKRAKSKAEILFGILHSHSPKNPQIITGFANIGLQAPLDIVMTELNAKIDHGYHKWEFIKKNIGKTIEQSRAEREKWRKESSKAMIRIIKPSKKEIKQREEYLKKILELQKTKKSKGD